MSLKEKFSDGTHKLHKFKDKIARKKGMKDIRILTDEEIADLSMAKLLNSTVELLKKNELLRIHTISDEMLNRFLRNGYKYTCSLKAADEVIPTFDVILSAEFDPNNIKRIGGQSYWHYFIRCKQSKIEELRKFAFKFS
jgi:hypothetical protein